MCKMPAEIDSMARMGGYQQCMAKSFTSSNSQTGPEDRDSRKEERKTFQAAQVCRKVATRGRVWKLASHRSRANSVSL